MKAGWHKHSIETSRTYDEHFTAVPRNTLTAVPHQYFANKSPTVSKRRTKFPTPNPQQIHNIFSRYIVALRFHTGGNEWVGSEATLKRQTFTMPAVTS